jgi:hypothetical protein
MTTTAFEVTIDDDILFTSGAGVNSGAFVPKGECFEVVEEPEFFTGSGVNAGAFALRGECYDIDDEIYGGVGFAGANKPHTGNISAKTGECVEIKVYGRLWQETDDNFEILIPAPVVLKYIAGPNGSIYGDTEQHLLELEDGSEVVAYPDPGYAFSKWSDGVLTASRTDELVLEDLTVVAIFTPAGFHSEGNLIIQPSSNNPRDVVIATGSPDPVGRVLVPGNGGPVRAMYDIEVTQWVYFGPHDINGSKRVGVLGGALVLQQRISGAWSTVKEL